MVCRSEGIGGAELRLQDLRCRERTLILIQVIILIQSLSALGEVGNDTSERMIDQCICDLLCT